MAQLKKPFKRLRRCGPTSAMICSSVESRPAAVEPAFGQVLLPDEQRLPGFSHWMWDGEFCGGIGFRWQPGTKVLPPHCLGHIGYAVVPWKKRRGHATRALAAMLPLARAEGLRYVELFVRLPSARADRSPCRRPKTLCGAIFVNGCPRGAYTFISSSVSLFDLGSPFLRSLIATQSALLLEIEEAPCELDHPASDSRVAGSGESLLPASLPAFVRRAREARIAGDGAPVASEPTSLRSSYR